MSKTIAKKTTNSEIVQFDPNDTNGMIAKLQAELDKIKSPSGKNLNVKINDIDLNNITDPQELLELRITVKREFELFSNEAKEISEKLKVKFPYSKTEKEVEEEVEAIDACINKLLLKSKIENLEKAIQKLKNLRSEKEKEEAREQERQREIEDVVKLISVE